MIGIFTFIYGLRRLIPLIQLKQIVELVCSLWFINEKHNIKGDLFRTVWITKTFDSYIVTRPGGRQEELLMGPPLKAGEWWPPWVGDGGINSLFVIPVSARWALLSLKTDYKISSFHPEIPGFDPGTFGVESWRTSYELPSSSVMVTIKTHPEYKHSYHGKYFIVVGCTVKSLWYKLIVYSINAEFIYQLWVYKLS